MTGGECQPPDETQPLGGLVDESAIDLPGDLQIVLPWNAKAIARDQLHIFPNHWVAKDEIRIINSLCTANSKVSSIS